MSVKLDTQKCKYYQDKDMLDIHLANKIAFFDKFDEDKCEIIRHRRSVTQGGVTLKYDDKIVYDYLEDKMTIDETTKEWKGLPDERWIKAIEEAYNHGDAYNDMEPIKNNYNLKSKLKAMEEIKEIATKQPDLIDPYSYYNFLAMLSHETKAPVLPKKFWEEKKEPEIPVNELEKLAIRKVTNDTLEVTLVNMIDSLREELKKEILLSNESLVAFKRDYLQDLYLPEVNSFYALACMNCKKTNPDLFERIKVVVDKLYDFIMERDVLKLQNADMEKIIKDNGLYKESNKNIFKGTTFKTKEEIRCPATFSPLPAAEDNHRFELFSEEKLSKFSFCEGDLVLKIFDNTDEYFQELHRVADFYSSENSEKQPKIFIKKEKEDNESNCPSHSPSLK